jgi:uncharacterized protein with WD repeat
MCQVRSSKGEIITKKIPSIATKTPANKVAIQAKRRLNPAATEFVSSRSESEASSIGDETDIEHQNQSDSEEVSIGAQPNRENQGSETDPTMDQYHEESEEHHRIHSYQNYGWESPQVSYL